MGRKIEEILRLKRAVQTVDPRACVTPVVPVSQRRIQASNGLFIPKSVYVEWNIEEILRFKRAAQTADPPACATTRGATAQGIRDFYLCLKDGPK